MDWFIFALTIGVGILFVAAYRYTSSVLREKRLRKQYIAHVNELMPRSWEELNMLAHDLHDACKERLDEDDVAAFHYHYHEMEAILMLGQMFGKLGDEEKRLLCMMIVTGRKVLEPVK
jgi:hypothetical protein